MPDASQPASLPARFPGTCWRCKLEFPAGAPIRSVQRKWAHYVCPVEVVPHLVEVFEVYTDGSSLGNPGRAGWAWYVGPALFASGHVPESTNNRMEMRAIVEALTALGPAHPGMTIWSDSRLVVEGVTRWSRKWKRNGWRTKDGTDIANRDLWEPLIQLAERFKPQMRWVKGHAGSSGNEMADQLAQRAAKGFPATSGPE